ncbi:hippocampus abundant transcript 1 protein-like [Convolutriloba macropyga]|uniref:hippocampus abundant transcript 1 protein-like n=1 Tax=Convolutriloba macropyga TaxID=536237 RepID=UPI003F527C44
MVAKRLPGTLRRKLRESSGMGIGKPSVSHALVVIFLEFFAWGLLTSPMLTLTIETFPQHSFLMNGIVLGIKGMLSFLSAPLLGALSDAWGRKSFLLISVFFTCMPIPLMMINSMWFFTVFALSGIFAVTFSVVLAYVADVTAPEERSLAYGMVAATFAASIIFSPAIGDRLAQEYNDVLVVALATAISALDLFFILVAVPESLTEKIRAVSWGKPISWEKADPFLALRRIGQDQVVMLVCGTVFLSYIPEAGEFSSLFLYLKQVIHFSRGEVIVFIAVVGILSVFAQSLFLSFLVKVLGNKKTILCGLVFQLMQLSWFAVARERWMIWCAGCLAAMSSIVYPAISGLVSTNAEPDQQGVVQGIVAGVRGLCSGLGPALFGFSFYLFDIQLKFDEQTDGGVPAAPPGAIKGQPADPKNPTDDATDDVDYFIPGPAFAIGAILVIFSLFSATLIPENFSKTNKSSQSPSILPKTKCSIKNKTAKASPSLSDAEDEEETEGFLIGTKNVNNPSGGVAELSVPLIKPASDDHHPMNDSLIHNA